ncbi:MAG: hypothetical protein K2H15_08015, partial [Muribaculaceae bacterium]|nr:hypothetical protein [Muribaculaceae bacterium]
KKKSVFRIVNLLSIVAVWSLILVSCGNKGNVKNLRNVILGNNNNPTDYRFILDTLLHQVGIADKMGKERSYMEKVMDGQIIRKYIFLISKIIRRHRFPIPVGGMEI